MRYKQNPPPKVDVDSRALQKRPMEEYIKEIPGYQEAKKREEKSNMDNIKALKSAWEVQERGENNNERCRYCGK